MKDLFQTFNVERETTKSYELDHGESLKKTQISDRKINKQTSQKLDGFLSPKQAAQYLNVSIKFIYEHMARGDIDAQPIGRLRRIRLSTLEDWLLCQKQRKPK